jgi:hypothetical protein
MGSLIQKAREAKPNIKILLGNVIHRSFIGGRQDLMDKTNAYNDRLWTAVGRWFLYKSPIEIVDVASAYNCRPDNRPDGYDGLHPNAMGEYHIAWAFAEAFRRRFNIVPRALPVPGSITRLPTTQPNGQKSHGLPEGACLSSGSLSRMRGRRGCARASRACRTGGPRGVPTACSTGTRG